jgi:hypothetical protein
MALDGIACDGIFAAAQAGVAIQIATVEIGPGASYYQKIAVKQGEAKEVQLLYKDEDGDPVDLTGVSAAFRVKAEKADETYLIEKEDADFNKADVADGILKFTLTTTDTNQDPVSGVAEAEVSFSLNSKDLTDDIAFIISEAVKDS